MTTANLVPVRSSWTQDFKTTVLPNVELYGENGVIVR